MYTQTQEKTMITVKSKIKKSFKKIFECRVCYSKELVFILSLGNQYLSDFVQGNPKIKKYPLELVICKKCSLVQLAHTTPPAYLYTERYGYRSGINDTMKKELAEIVKKALKKKFLKKDDLVVDIGSNDGTLLSNYKKGVTVGFEPVKKFAKASEKFCSYSINDYFSYSAFQKLPKSIREKKVKIVTAISMFYDIDAPNNFLKDITKVLDKNGILIIQQNYLPGMLLQNAFDNILHELLEYYSLASIEYLLAMHNMYVFDVEETPINGGSFRTYIRFKDNNKNKVSSRVKKMKEKEKKLMLSSLKTYRDFASRVDKIISQLHDFIYQKAKEGNKIYLYGASTRGNTLIQSCKFNNKVIFAAVERNPEKWGKKIASVRIPIITEEKARQDKPDYMLVLPWFFKKEFLKREKEYLKKGGHFIFPLPKITVV